MGRFKLFRQGAQAANVLCIGVGQNLSLVVYAIWLFD
jgi:hypothetical protein